MKLINKIKCLKTYAVGCLIMSYTFVLENVSIGASGIGDKLNQNVNVVQNEGLSISDVILFVGVIIIGLMFMLGMRENGKKIGISIIVGYLIIRYVAEITGFVKNFGG